MALPASVEDAFKRVRSAAEVLGKACYEAEQPGVKADEERKKNAQKTIQQAATELEVRAKQLADAAHQVR